MGLEMTNRGKKLISNQGFCQAMRCFGEWIIGRDWIFVKLNLSYQLPFKKFPSFVERMESVVRNLQSQVCVCFLQTFNQTWVSPS